MRGPDKADATAELEARYAEIRDALDWSLDHDRPDDAFRLATALVPFWMATKRLDDGDAWFDRALRTRAGSEARWARALYDHGYLVFWAGRYDLAERRFIEARDLGTKIGDPNLVGLALAGSGRVALERDPSEAVRLLGEALALTADLPDSEGHSSADHVIAVALQMSGDLEGARDVMLERLATARKRGNEYVVWVESSNLSMVERQLGNLDRAAALSREALAIVGRQRDGLGIPWVMNGLAAVTAAQGDDESAATLLGMAESLLARAGGEWPPDEREQYDGTLSTLRSRMTPETFDRARATGSAMSLDEALAFALTDRPASSN
jgi:tetratricopeptide (TPR) repeat protein